MKSDRLSLFAAVLTPLALAGPAQGQTAARPTVRGESAATAELLRRLDALQQRVDRLERENTLLQQGNSDNAQKAQALDDKIEWRTGRLEKVENKVATLVKPGVAPTLGDSKFNFKLRGVLDIDYASYDTKTGSYAFNNGTAFRRARLGAEGTAFKDLYWRFETEFAGNTVAIQDAYIQYNAVPHWAFTAGQHKAPFGLESQTSDNYNTFVERSTGNLALSTALAERRIGLSARYFRDDWSVMAGLFGENESVNRANGGPKESFGVNARATWTPVNTDGKLLHVGAAAAYKTAPRASVAAGTATVGGTLVATPAGARTDAVIFSGRPNSNVDGGNIASTGIIPNVDDLKYYGMEAAAGYGPATLWGEYGHVDVARFGANPDIGLDTFYVAGSWFLTGESRPFKDGAFDRLRPRRDFGKGGWGAWELAARYDAFDFADPANPNANNRGNKGHSYTAALDWYWNGNFKILANWVHFIANASPLAASGTGRITGDAYTVRAHVDW